MKAEFKEAVPPFILHNSYFILITGSLGEGSNPLAVYLAARKRDLSAGARYSATQTGGGGAPGELFGRGEAVTGCRREPFGYRDEEFASRSEIFEYREEVFDYLDGVFDYLDEVFNYPGSVFDYLDEVFNYLGQVFDYVGHVLDYLDGVFNYTGRHNSLRSDGEGAEAHDALYSRDEPFPLASNDG